MKYILITGGVISGLGKGITCSSLGVLLKACGLHVTAIKIDPYLNIDAGTMSPYEHGEVFVLDDGGEADLDLGNYERFLDITLTKDHNITTGKIYQLVLEQERQGKYMGKTVQVVPHITNAVIDWITRISQLPAGESNVTPDVCLIELGGTVGDIEGMIYLEALRQLRYRVGNDNFYHVHVSLVPTIAREPKSKPTQHGVKELRSAGLSPDLIACRGSAPLDEGIREKISMFCMVPSQNVVSLWDVSNIYRVPEILRQQGVIPIIQLALKLEIKGLVTLESVPKWDQLVARIESKELPEIKIGIVGKYTEHGDAYLSLLHALTHAGLSLGCRVIPVWFESTTLTDPVVLREVKGILIPGGFGGRGIPGMILAAQYARENKVPYLGICLGMQVAVIEYAQNVTGIKGATSEEFADEKENKNSDTTNVIIFMPEGSTTHVGGTMRLGLRTSKVKSGTLCEKVYAGATTISERHRHRYEISPKFVNTLEEKGLIFGATGDHNMRMETIELSPLVHPFYFGTQYHPELLSRPFRPSPPFVGFIRACE